MITFDEAIQRTHGKKKPAILLGNGFSQSCQPKIFNYSNLYSAAHFGQRDKIIRSIFDELQTYDFEMVMRTLLAGELVVDKYQGDQKLNEFLKEDQEILKNALLKAISDTHPELPSAITQAQYEACRKFLSKFCAIYTLNYDLLMYWARNKNEIQPIPWNTDDGFRKGGVWNGYETDQDIFFLHGGLHLFRDGGAIKKHISQEFNSIIEQVKQNLARNIFPIFVSEPTAERKKIRIDNNPYLTYCYRSLRSTDSPVFIFGHSMDENDKHIFDQISASKTDSVFVSIYGDENSEGNMRLKANAMAYLQKANRSVDFFDAASAPAWV
jgi:hypothetical protein